MIFHENSIKIHHKAGGYGISFCALDALKMIDAQHLPEGIKIASTDSWRASRQDCEFIDKEVVGRRRGCRMMMMMGIGDDD